MLLVRFAMSQEACLLRGSLSPPSDSEDKTKIVFSSQLTASACFPDALAGEKSNWSLLAVESRSR